MMLTEACGGSDADKSTNDAGAEPKNAELAIKGIIETSPL